MLHGDDPRWVVRHPWATCGLLLLAACLFTAGESVGCRVGWRRAVHEMLTAAPIEPPLGKGE